MIHKSIALFLALVLSLGTMTTVSLPAFAQNTTNATTTAPPPIDLSVFNQTSPEVQETAEEAAVNQSAEATNQTNQTQGPITAITEPVKQEIIVLLDSAEDDIEEARDLLNNLTQVISVIEEEQQEAAANESAAAAANDTTEPEAETPQEEIVIQSNDSANEIVEIVEESQANDSSIEVENLENATQDVVEVIEDSVNSESNATAENIENATAEVIEAVEEVETENPALTQSALIRLLTNVVLAQNYNDALPQEDKDELMSDLQDTIAEQASEVVDALANSEEEGNGNGSGNGGN